MFSRPPRRAAERRTATAPQVVADRQVVQGGHDGARASARDRLAVRRQVLHGGQRHHVRRDVAQRVPVYSTGARRAGRTARTVRRSAGRSRRWAARGWSRRSSRRATPAPRAHEDRPGVAYPQRPSRASGLDLQVLGGVRVDHPQPGVEVVDEHDAALLAAERGADPLGVLGRRHLPGQLAVDRVGQRRRG